MINFIRRSRKGSTEAYNKNKNEKYRCPFMGHGILITTKFVIGVISCCLMVSFLTSFTSIKCVENNSIDESVPALPVPKYEEGYKDFDGDVAPIDTAKQEVETTKVKETQKYDQNSNNSSKTTNEPSDYSTVKTTSNKSESSQSDKEQVNNSSIQSNSSENQTKKDSTKYPVATKIWNYLKGLGYTDNQVAGIMGNMMVESGGNTLNIRSDSHNSAHWGICQWSKKYFPNIWGSDLDYQLSYFKTWVSNVPNDSYSNVSYWFWKNYERSGHYSEKRAQCAKTAYEYFTN